MGIRRLAPLAIVALVLGPLSGPAAAAPPPVPWPGGSTVTTVDNANQFGQNLSGLAYEDTGTDAILWAVRNGPSTLFKLVRSGATWVPAPGEWSAGKNLTFAGTAVAPDSEGVTFTDEGSAGGVFISSERRLNVNVSRPEIIRYDVAAAGAPLASTGVWDLTADLPVIGPNAGPEAIAWVPDSYLTAKGLLDESTGAAYAPASYPNHGRGLFFVGLEANGTIYAYALDLTGSTYTRVATFASSFTGVMDLTFETETDRLWAACDDTCQGRTATLDIVDGAFTVTAVYDRPAGLPNYNNEGFTITPQSECVGGTKPVFWADDSTRVNVLRSGTLNCTVPPPCLGLQPTITGSGYILGTPGDDVILGSSGVDTINAGGGNDTICGGGGADTLNGEGGTDALDGGADADTLTGGDGADSVQGGPGDDKLLEGATASGADVLDGGADADAVFYSSRTAAVTVTTTGAGNDGGVGEGDTVTAIETVRGGSGNDYLTGSSAAETFVGGAGADTITGGAGADEIHGGAGNDRLVEGSTASGADILDGGADLDTVNYSARTATVKVSTTGSGNDGQSGEGDTVAAVEIVRAGSGSDSLAGSAAAETFYGGPGADRISAGTGSDVLYGEAGQDQLLAADGVNGNDTVDGGADADTATADPGDVVTNVP